MYANLEPSLVPFMLLLATTDDLRIPRNKQPSYTARSAYSSCRLGLKTSSTPSPWASPRSRRSSGTASGTCRCAVV